MAFLRSLRRQCDRCGQRGAVEQLLTWRNDIYGNYCTPCSTVMLRQVKASEEAQFARERGGARGAPGDGAA